MTGEIIPVPLRYGEPEDGARTRRHPILNDFDVEVGVTFEDLEIGKYTALLFEDEGLTFASFRINQLLVTCGVWLAYKESIKIP